MSQLLRVLFGLVLAVLSVGACTSAASSESRAVQTRGFAGIVGALEEQSVGEALNFLASTNRNDFVLECMRSAGFSEYQTLPVNQPSQRSRPGDPEGDLSDDEYAKAFGFGISESAFGELQIPDLGDSTDYYDSLSTLEKQAWQDTKDACDLAAIESLSDLDALVTPLFEAQQEVDERLGADSRVIAAEEGWAACMADKGFAGWSDPGDLAFGYADELVKCGPLNSG